jgi:DNA-binding LacI/PurR family transcriptional regulator
MSRAGVSRSTVSYALSGRRSVSPETKQRIQTMIDEIGYRPDAARARSQGRADPRPSGGDHDRSFERLISGRRVDGVILAEIRLEDERITRLQQAALPFVTIGHTAHPHGTCWVDVNYATLVAPCVHHVADLGHRTVALINRSTELVARRPGHPQSGSVSSWCPAGPTTRMTRRGSHPPPPCRLMA